MMYVISTCTATLSLSFLGFRASTMNFRYFWTSCRPSATVGSFWETSGSSGDLQGRFGDLGNLSGSLGDLWQPSGKPLGRSGTFGEPLGTFGNLWGTFVDCWSHSGTILRPSRKPSEADTGSQISSSIPTPSPNSRLGQFA